MSEEATRRPLPPAGAALDAAAVATYLAAHPDFLVDHADLVAQLRLPLASRGEGVIDLQGFVVERLRAEVRRLKDLQRDLIATTRQNAAIQARVHKAVLALLAADSFETLIQAVSTDLAVILDVDICALCVEATGGISPGGRLAGVQILEAGLVDAFLGTERRTRLRANILGDPELFGAGVGLVRADALVRLDFGRQGPKALVAFGSRRPDGFHPGQGTELLCFLANVLELTVRQWLDLPAD